MNLVFFWVSSGYNDLSGVVRIYMICVMVVYDNKIKEGIQKRFYVSLGQDLKRVE